MEGGDPWSPMTMASLSPNNYNPTTVRFLGILKLPDSDPNHFVELDESDVVWSPDLSVSPPGTNSPPNSTESNSPTNTLRLHHHHFFSDKSGLSAALSDDNHPILRRKQALNPSLSAARMIPPVALIRSESSGGINKLHQSAPMNVPIWPKKNSARDFDTLGSFDDIDDDDDGEMVPPHEIVARSHVTFSVFEGVGRTLKGRDLRRVRNAVFQKTGAKYNNCWSHKYDSGFSPYPYFQVKHPSSSTTPCFGTLNNLSSTLNQIK